ncbi:hypothetical protein FXO37_12424 [Capsicum annuum]|nr:hypothetical protein FXO37_12424 [Capsicum annuum]
MYSSKIIACNTNLGFTETLLSKRENFPAWIKCYPSPSSTKNANGTLLSQAGFRTRKWSPFQVSCSRERDISVIEAGCMDDIYDSLAEHLVPTAAASSPNFK